MNSNNLQTIFFAQDFAAKDTLTKVIAIIVDYPLLNWRLLIDSVFDYEADEAVKARYEKSDNCFAGSWLESGEAVAPRLVALPKVVYDAQGRVTSTKALSDVLEDWLKHCNGRPMLSVIGCAKPVEKLIEQWQNLLPIKTEEGKKYLLRFADTRTLLHLPTVLFAAEQWSSWGHGVGVWLTLDRKGQVTILPKVEEIKPLRSIVVPNEAFQKMRDLEEADSYLTMLYSQCPGLFEQDVPRSQFHDWASEVLTLAHKAEIESSIDRLMLITKTIDTQGRLLKVPELSPFLNAKKWEEDALIKALREQPWFQIIEEETAS